MLLKTLMQIYKIYEADTRYSIIVQLFDDRIIFS